jgi:hypothetical protein
LSFNCDDTAGFTERKRARIRKSEIQIYKHDQTLKSTYMKKSSLFLGAACIALGFSSCKDAKETQAEKSVETYVSYVDSIDKVAVADAQKNWEAIDASYQQRAGAAEAALANVKEKEKDQERIAASKAKYEAYRASVQAASAPSAKQLMRNALFGEGKISGDINFDWVNKDNILGVYEQFVNTAESNKNNYSREDWDEIKLLYEGLDSRKNTVEKEGLSGADNRKIAALKLKFAPMLKMKRMGAKGEEMEKAKENN